MKQLIDIGLIEPNKGQIPGVPKNPRLIKDQKFEKLKKSIQEDPEMLELRGALVFPFKGKFVAIGGNMRYEACKALGHKAIPCEVIPEATTIEKLKAYSIKDNASFGEWDFDMLANEWEAQDLTDWGLDLPELDLSEAEEDAKEDDFDVEAAITKNPVSKPGDVWQLGRHRLFIGSATDPEGITKLMNGKEANLVITDPPYNVNYQGGTDAKLKIQGDNMTDGAFKQLLVDSFTNMNANLKKGGSFYIWHPDSGGHNFRNACQEIGWHVRQCLIWKKNALVLGRQDYQWIHEPCLYGWKDGASHYFVDERANTTVYEDVPNIEKLGKDELKKLLKEIYSGKIATTVIEENKPARNGEHPTMKPVKLIGRLIKNSSKPGQIILDLFGGSGTTIIAAEQLSRSCYMSELDPVYGDVIIKRWETLTEESAELVHTNPA